MWWGWVSGVHRREGGDGGGGWGWGWLRFCLVSLQDVGRQVLGEDRLILARHGRVLPLEELQRNTAQLHRPEVAFALRFARVLQHLWVEERRKGGEHLA